MGKDNMFDWIRGKIGSVCWKIFLWANRTTEGKYWESIYQQERELKLKFGLLKPDYTEGQKQGRKDLAKELFDYVETECGKDWNKPLDKDFPDRLFYWLMESFEKELKEKK